MRIFGPHRGGLSTIITLDPLCTCTVQCYTNTAYYFHTTPHACLYQKHNPPAMYH